MNATNGAKLKVFWTFVLPNITLFTLAMIFDYDINKTDNGLWYVLVLVTWMVIAGKRCYPEKFKP